MSAAHPAARNIILSLLAKPDFSKVAKQLEPVDLPKNFSVVEADQTISHVYFPTSGLASILAVSPEGQKAEAGLFGRCGFGPVAPVLGSDQTSNPCVMQIAGAGYRIAREAFVQILDECPAVRLLAGRFALSLGEQTGYTALSNAVHQVDERLARWLLMCHDRSESDDLALTHEYMSIMLTVRRPSVTSSLHVLEGNGFIRSARGYVTIRNRIALEEFAGDAYGKPEAAYRRLIGPLK